MRSMFHAVPPTSFFEVMHRTWAIKYLSLFIWIIWSKAPYKVQWLVCKKQKTLPSQDQEGETDQTMLEGLDLSDLNRSRFWISFLCYFKGKVHMPLVRKDLTTRCHQNPSSKKWRIPCVLFSRQGEHDELHQGKVFTGSSLCDYSLLLSDAKGTWDMRNNSKVAYCFYIVTMVMAWIEHH